MTDPLEEAVREVLDDWDKYGSFDDLDTDDTALFDRLRKALEERELLKALSKRIK